MDGLYLHFHNGRDKAALCNVTVDDKVCLISDNQVTSVLQMGFVCALLPVLYRLSIHVCVCARV